ncbi:MAG TPA: FAD-dependent oxidoreductase [Candidatus Limnocylindrales bacterium]|nr:FAD-dependent oxidoreductase [Candidatus Limnocylindrales bacterium]
MAVRVPVVVVGGGVVGCAILRELTRRGVRAVLVEAAPDVCEGTSKANSAIVHTGFDAKAGTVEARMLRRAAALWPALVDELGVPFLSVGALMLARTPDDADRLRSQIAGNADTLGVRTELLDENAVREVAPYLAVDVVAALSIPDEAVVDPFWLTRALAEAAMAGGAEVRLGHAVAALDVGADEVRVGLDDGTEIAAEQVIDAAGIRADQVARLAGDDSFTLSPRKGQFLVSEETFGVDRIVLPIPGPLGKGMLVTPIVFGGLLLGPTAVDTDERDDRSTDPAEAERILAACASMVPAVGNTLPVRAFAGLRHVSSTGDFIVRPSTVSDRLYLAAGIRSTGISTSPAIAEAVVDEVVAVRGWRTAEGQRRTLPAPPAELLEDPGEVVCLCRSIGRGEIEAACRRPLAPATLDAVKRRGGATFGDCQGNLCALEVASILAAERGVEVSAVEKHRRGSWLWQRADGTAAPQPRPGDRPAVDRRDADVVVIGAGAAGRAAAEAIRSAGARVVSVARAGGRVPLDAAADVLDTTVVGLSPSGDGWLVLGQAAAGSLELEAPAVLVATGAYVEPREQRRIAGPRPSGVMTADLAERLLDAGLRPGRVVVLVGANGRADALAGGLDAAGAEVVRIVDPPLELRGEARLTGIRTVEGWIEADSLVLADRLVPQAFVLRGLGLLDARPGTPLPVGPDGRLPLPGLWAAGCCVAPAFDHAACAAAGRSVGEAIVRSLAVPAARTDGVVA